MSKILKKTLVITFLFLTFLPHFAIANEGVTAENNIIIDAFTQRKNRLLELI